MDKVGAVREALGMMTFRQIKVKKKETTMLYGPNQFIYRKWCDLMDCTCRVVIFLAELQLG